MLGKQLKEIREVKKISVNALAAMTNVQPNRIHSFEKDEANITINTLEQLLSAMNKRIIFVDSPPFVAR